MRWSVQRKIHSMKRRARASQAALITRSHRPPSRHSAWHQSVQSRKEAWRQSKGGPSCTQREITSATSVPRSEAAGSKKKHMLERRAKARQAALCTRYHRRPLMQPAHKTKNRTEHEKRARTSQTGLITRYRRQLSRHGVRQPVTSGTCVVRGDQRAN